MKWVTLLSIHAVDASSGCSRLAVLNSLERNSMNSSGIKRGLAVTAISALAVTGAPFLASTASADSVTQRVTNTADADSTVLYSQYSGQASVQNDGANTTIHLLAGGGTNVASVRFEYGPVATPTTIATVGKTNGVFSTEWAPAQALLGQTVVIRAVALNAVGNPTAAGTDDTQSATISANTAATDISTPAGAPTGFFQQPYGTEVPENGTALDGVSHDTAPAIVTGTTSATTGNIELSDQSNGSRVFAGTALPAVTGDADANGVRSFRGTVNFADYPYDTTANATNEAIAGAVSGDITTPAAGNTPAVFNRTGADDTEVLNLRSQTITTVTATAANATVNNGDAGSVTVTATDQFGQLLSGAQVIYDANNNNDFDNAERVGYTNANGQVVFNNLDVTDSGSSTFAFYVNVDDDDPYQANKDFRRTVTINSAAQTASGLTTTSADGAAFDVDENQADDLQATLVDSSGQPIAGQAVQYSYTFTAFPTTAAPNPTATTTPAAPAGVTNAQGKVNIPFTSQGSGNYVLNTFIERDGTPGQSAGDLSAPALNFKAGQADLDFVQDSPATAAQGSTATFDVTLALEDNTVLPGRLVNFNYAAPAGGNSQIAPNSAQPAGTTQTAGGAADTTDANGVANVAIVDPATPATAELGGTLTANTGNTPTSTTSPDGNANAATATLMINFAVNTLPTGGTVVITPGNNTNGKPGVQTATSTVTITDTDNDGAGPDTANGPVAGTQVTLTVDKGFFTDGTPDPAPAVGNDAGELNSLGTTITVTTNASGQATFNTAIEGDDDFDDDGLATQIVTATVGSTSDTEDYIFDSSAPLNGSDVSIEFSPDAQQDSGILPQAQSGQDDVAFDVTAFDQFGNPVGGETVAISDDSATATTSTQTVTTDFDPAADFTLSDTGADDDVTVTATYMPDTLTYTGVGNATQPGTATYTADQTVNFYAIDFANSTFSLTHTGTDPQPVGTTVTETYNAVDQNGEPISGLDIQFFRAGPDAQGDGDGNSTDTTNANGDAFYVFQGTQAGDANITAVARQAGTTTNNGTLVPEGRQTDTVTFGKATPPPLTAVLKAPNNGGTKDKVRIIAKPVETAAGATVRLYSRSNGTSGRKVLLSTRKLNETGRRIFVRPDRNGNRRTVYFAVVSSPGQNVRTNSRTAK